MSIPSNSSNAKKSTVRHTRAIQRDRSKRPTVAPSASSVEQMLSELIHPATYAQVAAYQDMGLRHRILTLPVMMAFVLSIIWRQIGSVREAVRVLHEEGVLWVAPLSVSQQGEHADPSQAECGSASVIQVLQQTHRVRDCIVALGQGTPRRAHPMRVVQMLVDPTKGKAAKWHSYLTNVVDPARLPAEYMVELYAGRWRMEDAFNTVKRVLGLAYLWCGAANAVQVQLWATWILYSVLVDLTDSVAEAIKQPMKALSVEMVFRALYHYTQACQRDPTLKVVDYLARKAKELGLLKQKRRPSHA